MTETVRPTEASTLLKSSSSGQEDASNKTRNNFYLMALFFSTNHGCMVACLSLATARLGAVGAIQSGVLSLSYMASAVLGATYVVKRFGARNAMLTGMLLYCAYVACFWVATSYPAMEQVAALTGATIGGFGAGFLWTAQGSYLAMAAKHQAKESSTDLSECTSNLAGVFAFIYLIVELGIRFMPTVLAGFVSWKSIYAIYTAIAFSSAFGMLLVTDYGIDDEENPSTSVFYKVTAALQLLFKDPKMKYMIGLSAAFGLASSFLNSYINGEVVKVALNDPDSVYVGALSSWISLSAALTSLVFRRVRNKGAVLIGGAMCFFFVAFPFVVQPDASMWNAPGLLTVYTLHGVGRSTFESTLKATFIDFFPTETAGAFSNIILQSGLSTAVGYFLSVRLECQEPSRYCIEYSDRTLHDVLSFELLVCFTAIAAILGYLRAANIHKMEQEEKAGLVLNV